MEFEFSQLAIEAAEVKTRSPWDRRRLLIEKSDLIRSSGPWLLFPQTAPVFDAMNAGQGLGYNAGALFGVVQHPVVWLNKLDDPDFVELQQSARQFSLRNPEWSELLRDSLPIRDQIRNYIAANVLEQFSDQSQTLESFAQDYARKLIGNRIPGLMSAIQFQGRLLTIDFHDRCDDPAWHLFCQRVLAEQDGSKVRLSLPISTCQSDLEFLFERIIAIWNHHETSPQVSAREHFDSLPNSLRDTLPNYRFHSRLLAYKIAIAKNQPPKVESELEFIRGLLPPSLEGSEVVLVNRENWPLFRQQVADMQTTVYEPSRQTEIKKFDELIADEFGFGLVVMNREEIAGMAFVGPIDLFPEERGTLDDPYRNDRHTMYILDLTVASDYRGTLGKVLKQSMTILSVAAGHHAIHGRNRDRLAAGMWNINLGMGSYELKRMIDDYPDNHRYRDCIYYRCPLRWPQTLPTGWSETLPETNQPMNSFSEWFQNNDDFFWRISELVNA